jgi:hypothetical protein
MSPRNLRQLRKKRTNLLFISSFQELILCILAFLPYDLALGAV